MLLGKRGVYVLEKTTRINNLLDFYRVLLTPKQRVYMDLYYLEDYSLGEISNTHDISRQAVYDNIRRTENILENYETTLQLYEKFKQRTELLTELEESFDQISKEMFQRKIQKIKELD